MGVGGRIETDRQTKTYGQTDRQTEKEEIVSKVSDMNTLVDS